MDAQEAEKIINAYRAVLGSSKDDVRRVSLLPCSVGKIRYAFYVYIDALAKNGALPLNARPRFMEFDFLHDYGKLNSFFDDARVEQIMNALSRINKGGAFKEDWDMFGAFVSPTSMLRAIDELQEYIAECTDGRWNQYRFG